MEIPEHPFTTADAAEQGISRQQLSRLTCAGLLHRPFHGVYHAVSLPDSLDLRAECARLVLPQHAVVADRSAAWLHGVDVLGLSETRLPPRLEVVSTAKSPSRGPQIYGGQRTLRPDEVTQLHGIAVTTPLRTAVALACLRGPARGLAAVEAFMRECGLTKPELATQLLRHRGRRGVIQAREIIGLAGEPTDSPGESFLKWFLWEAGLPIFAQQHPLFVPGVGHVFLDFALVELRIAIEYDGEEFHGPGQREHDETRRRGLGELGWLVIVVRKEDFAPAQRERWLGQLRDAIAERAPQFRRTYPAAQPRERRSCW